MASKVASASVPAEVAAAAAAAAKPKRVRTGCLTCRERHLKCDEGAPDCQNCKKSNRECKRGVRLNFIDTTVKTPPITPPTEEWDVVFQDESREIASEYRGGLGRYANLAAEAEVVPKEEPQYDFSDTMIQAPVLAHQQLPSSAPFSQTGFENYPSSIQMQDQDPGLHQRHGSVNSDSTFSSHTLGANSVSSYNNKQTLTPPTETRETLTDPEELLLMQVFVEEVGIWMDSMDPYKHFSRLLPFDSLGEPMLLNAFLACGARHLILVNPAYQEDKALHYYDSATRLLLNQLQNPYRDTVICATTAVILNVYELMCERALQRMNHIAGARALIKECGWNANSVGIGAACFWLNVGLELLSCLHFNWQVAWNPDDWGLDMDFSQPTGSGREEIWTYRMMWILAKVANFRASTTPRPTDPPQDHMRIQQRYEEWKQLKDWCDAWNNRIPRTMQPLGRSHPYQQSSKSLFPEVWLIKRATVVARMFYHTALIVLTQTNPMTPISQQEVLDMQAMQLENARECCGIIAHVKDRGVASVALRSIHHAGECIISRPEQEEVLTILNKIHKETGWRIQFVIDDMTKKWGWNDQNVFDQQQQMPNIMAQAPNMVQAYTSQFQQQNQGIPTSMPPAPPIKPILKGGVINPMLAKADFSQTVHPYQNYWVPPNQHPGQQTQFSHF